MKTKIICSILIIALLTSVFCSCSDGWNGYKNANLEKYIVLGKYKGLVYTPASLDVSDEDVESYINEKLQGIPKSVEITERAAQKGDSARISYKVYDNETEIPEFAANDVLFPVGETVEDSMLSDLGEKLIGAVKDDEIVITVDFPEDYTIDSVEKASLLAGKTITFRITVVSINTTVIPELTDETAAELSETAKTADEYRGEVKKQLSEARIADAEAEDLSTLWAMAVDNAEVIEYPKEEVDSSKDRRYTEYKKYAAYYGKSLENFIFESYGKTLEQFMDELEEYAKKEVKERLVLQAIIRAEGLSLSDDEYTDGLNAYYEEYGEGFSSPGELEQYLGVDEIETGILWDKVISIIKESAEAK